MSKRVVVTGMGTVNPVGNSVHEYWDGLIAGKSGIDTLTHFTDEKIPSQIAGEVTGVDFSEYVDRKEVKKTDRYILLAMAAAQEALQDSKLLESAPDMERVGTIIGSGIGGIDTLETNHSNLLNKGARRVSPFLIPMMIADMASGFVSMKYGLKGPNYCVVSACASSSHSIGDGFMALRAGMMDACLVGGAEAAISRLSYAGFASMKALSTRNESPQKASSPFDRKRDGFVMGEGSGVLVIETLEHALQRGAPIYAELTGYGATGDAHHLSSPAPNGEGAVRSMNMALRTAECAPEDIDYINAHGTSTPMNDKNETAAIKTTFGDHAYDLSVSSTKSMTGHLLGASGAIELIASIQAIREGIIPPTINYEDPDEGLDLDYTPNTANKRTVRRVMSNSFGFGGHNASLIVEAFRE
ncbi:beta-ketoacyl-ACP synthase II [Chitinivibrio alkaliphilus]|uniref:3-oxoacyl-[acyl-carrier-protein] synthase 2 n=1 Tax=Chitinivibrio alkaliphilus ACht1 TaxID=1313304 RepID=U7D8H6_9BACT|nr:beta-ketoacyl-ACP synthase II [Chitinivibrio alkaliphilus]ERP38699.1 3-oxoacyl-(acyl-carrier-protein) synthase II [Chitinivibrio alkaliphilus ACht1]